MARPVVLREATKPRRAALLARTTLGGLALLGSGAQALPGAPIAPPVFSAGGQAPVITNPNAATLDIKFNAARTVLQYNGFDVGMGETVQLNFVNRSDIGVIRNVGQNAINIDGALKTLINGAPGGNVWLLSASGVFFGASAQVDVGGLLASTAEPSNLLTGFVDSNSLSFNFDSANPNGQVRITEGARITGNGGSLAFIAPTVISDQGSTVSGDGRTSVLYGAAEKFVVNFVRGPGDDLDLLNFEVASLTDGSGAETTLRIGGDTTAHRVYLASVGKAQTIASVLSVQGNITATSAGLEGGSIVLTSGGNITNRAAAPLFTGGQLRQSVQVSAGMTATGDITATATGDISFFSDVSAGGSIVLSGLSIDTRNLTASQDVILHAADQSGYGYGYGYGYGFPGIFADNVTAGDDFIATVVSGDINIGGVVLTGAGADLQSDPLGLDGSGDHRMLLRTTGDSGDVRLGLVPSFRSAGEGAGLSSNVVVGGDDKRIEAVGSVLAFGPGDLALTSITAGDRVNLDIFGSMTIGSISAVGYIFAQATGSVAITGNATTVLDSQGNGQIVLHGGTGASIASANAAADLFVIADTGDAVAGNVTAGDDVFMQAYQGNISLTSATLGGGPDVDGSFVSTGTDGYGQIFGFSLLNYNEDRAGEGGGNGYGNVIHLDTYDDNFDGGDFDRAGQLGLDIKLGLGTGSISGYSKTFLDSARDLTVDLVGAATLGTNYAVGDLSIKTTGSVSASYVDSLNNASIVSTGGDAYVAEANVDKNLSIVATTGQAGIGTASVTGDFLLDGATVSLGFIGGGNGEGEGEGSQSPLNVTIRTRAAGEAGNFSVDRLGAENDLTLDIAGNLKAGDLSAGRDIKITAGGDATFSAGAGEGGEGEGSSGSISAGRDFSATAANILIGPNAFFDVGRDVTLAATAVDGSVNAASLTAGDDLRITGANIQLDYGQASGGGDDSEGDGANIVLTGGNISAASLGATGDIIAVGTGIGSYGFAVCRFGCEGGGAFAGRDLSLTGSSLVFSSSLFADRDLILKSTVAGLDVSEQSLDAGRNISLTSAAVLTAGSLDANGDIILDGASVNAAQLSARGSVSVVARTGDATVTRADVAQDLSVVAALGLAAVGDATVGRDFVLSGARATLGSLAAYQPGYGYGYGYGYGVPSPTRDITITTTAGDFVYGALLAGTRDVRANIGGNLGLATVTAGNDLNLRATGTLALSDAQGTTTAGRDAVIDGGSVALAGLTAGQDLTATARTGTLGATGTLQAGDDLRLASPTISVTDLVIASGQNDTETDGRTITMDGGSATLVSATAPGNIRATLTGALTTGGLIASSGGSVNVTAASIAQTVPAATNLVFNGNTGVSLVTTGAIDTGGLQSNAAVLANAGTSLRMRGDFSGQSASLAGNSVTLDGLVRTTGTQSITARAGAVNGQALQSDGDVTVSATGGGISLASVRAGDDAMLTATGNIGVTGAITAGSTANGTLGTDSELDLFNIRVAGAAVSLYRAVAPTDIVVTGNSVNIATGVTGLDAVAAGRDATINALTGNAVVGDASVRRDLTVTAALGLAQVGNARVGQDVRLTGASVALTSLAAFTESAGYGYGVITTPTRDLIVLATAGGFTSAGALTLSRDASFDVSGALSLAQLTAGRDIAATAAGIVIGNATAADDISLNGTTINAASLTTQGLNDNEADNSNIVATGGTIRIDNAQAFGDFSATALAGLTLAQGEGSISAGRDLIASGATLNAGQLTAQRDLKLTVTAGDYAATSLQSAGRDLSIDASGAVTGSQLTAARDLTVIGASVNLGSLVATRDLTATARTGSLTLGSATAGDDVRLSGSTIAVNFVSTGASALDTETDGSNIVATGGTIRIDRAQASDDFTATATGALTLGQGEGGIDAGRDLVASGASLNAGPLAAGRDLKLTVTAGNYAATSLQSAGRDLFIDASGTVTGSQLTAARDLSVIGAAIALDSLAATRDLTATARTGDLSLGSASAGDDVRLSGSTIVVNFVSTDASALDTEADGSNIVASGGTIRIDNAQAFDDFSATALAGLTLGQGEGSIVAGRDIFASGGTLDLGSLEAGRDLSLISTASSIASGSSLTAVRDLRVDSFLGIDLIGASAGRDLSLIARSGALTSSGDLSAGGSAVLSGTSIAVGAGVIAANDLTATAVTDLSLASAEAGDDVRLGGGGTISVDNLVRSTGAGVDSEGDGSNIVVGGTDVRIADAFAARDLRVDAIATASVAAPQQLGRPAGPGTNAIGDPVAQAGQDIIVNGASLELGTLDAGRDLLARASAGDLAASSTLRAGRDLIASATGNLSVDGDASAGRNAFFDAADARLAGLTAGQDARLNATTGDAVLASASVVRDLTVTAASGLASIGTASVGQDLVLTGARVALGSLAGYGSGYGYGYGYGYGTPVPRDATIRATAGGFAAPALSVSRDLTIDVSGALGIAAIAAGRDVLLAGADIDGGGSTVAAGRDLTANARAGNLILGNVTAGDDIRLSTTATGLIGALIANSAGTDTELDGHNIVVTGAALTLAWANAADDVLLNATGALTVSGAVVAGRDAILSGGTLALAGVQAGRDLGLTASASSFTATNLSAIRDLSVDAAGTLTLRDSNAGRNVSLAGASIAGRNVVAGQDFTATARSGNLTLARVTAGDDVRLDTTATGLINSITTTGAGTDSEVAGSNIVVTGGSIELRAANAATDLLVTASGAAVVGVAADGDTGTEGLFYQGIAGRDIVVAGASVLTGPLDAARDATLTAGSGGIQGRDNVVAGRDILGTSTGSVAFLRNVDAGNDVRLDGSSVAVPTIFAGHDASVTGRSGNVQIGSASVRNDLTVGAAQGLAEVFGANVGGDFRLSGAQVALTNLDGYTDSDENFTPTRDLIVVATAGGLTGAPDINVSRDVSITVTGLAQIGSVIAGNDIGVTSSGIELGSLAAGRDVSLTATSIDGQDNVTAGRDITASAATGLRFADLTSGDDIRLSTTAGDIVVGAVQASGSTDNEADGANFIATGRDITLATAFADADVLLTASRALTATGGISAGRDARLSGGTLALAQVSAGRDLALAATASNLAVGSVSAVRDLSLDSAGALSFASADAGGNIVLGGASIDGGNVTTRGGIVATARSGSLQIADIEAATDATIVALTGDAIVGDARVGRDLTVTAALGLAQVGNAFVGQDIRLSGARVALASLDGYTTPGQGNGYGYGYGYGTFTRTRDAIIVATAGGLSGGADLTVARDLSITVTGDATTGALIAGNDISAAAGGALGFTSANAGRDVILVGNGITAAGIVAGRDATLTSTAGISTSAIFAGDDVRLSANGPVTVAGRIDATGLGGDSEGDGANAIVSGAAVDLGDVQAAQDVRLTGAGLATGALIAGRDLALTATATNLNTGNISAVRDLILDASGALTLGSATAGRDATLTARGGTLTAASISAGDDVRLSASGPVAVAGRIDATGLGGDSEGDGSNAIVSGAAVSLGDVQAAQDVRLTGTSLATGALIAGRNLALTATATSLTTGNISAVRDLILDAGGALTLGTATAGRDATLTARGGTLTAGAISAGDDVRLAASGGVTVNGGIDATGLATDTETDSANVAVTAGGVVTTGAIRAAQDIAISGSGLSTGALIAGRDLRLTTTATGLSSGNVSATRDLILDANGALTLGTATAGRDATLTSRTGTLTATNVVVGDDARLSGASVAVGTVRATGLGGDTENDGSNVVLGGGILTASQLAATNDISVIGTGAVSVGQAAAGRDVLISGATVGGTLQLSGRDLIVTSGGALVAGQGLVATRDIRLTAATTLSFAQLNAARDLTLTSAVVQGGNAVAARDLTVIATTRIGGNLYQAGRNLILDPNEVIQANTVRATGNATLIGASIDVGLLEAGGTTLAQATAGGIAIDTLTSGGATTLLATGTVALGASTTPALRIVAGDLDVRRSLVATTLQVETPGRMIIGGTAGANETGFRLAAADIARVRVTGTTSFYAGLTATLTAPGGDLILQDFAYNPANLPSLAFYADRSHVVDVQGKVLPSVTGGSIVIGDASANGRFRPGSIYVSGGFGSADLIANCFGNIVAVGSLSLYSVNDVIFGASDFRAAIQTADAATIDLVAGTPSVPAGPADNRLFAVATSFTVDGAGKIVSQNTASDAGAYVGLFFNGNGANGPIIRVGNARAIDLSGSLVDAQGNLRSGPTVAFAGELGSGGSNGTIFRFNGCIVGSLTCGSGAGGATPAEALRLEDYQPPRPIDVLDEPLSTVLIVEQAPAALEVLTIGTDSDTVVIRKRKIEN